MKCCEGKKCIECENFDWSCNACKIEVNHFCECEKCKSTPIEKKETEEEREKGFFDDLNEELEEVSRNIYRISQEVMEYFKSKDYLEEDKDER